MTDGRTAMLKCKKCFKDKDESEFSTRFDGTKFYFCKECLPAYYAERRNNKGFAFEVAVKRAKGRQLRRLSETQVTEIKAKRAGGTPLAELATEYGVSTATVSKLARFGYSNA